MPDSSAAWVLAGLSGEHGGAGQRGLNLSDNHAAACAHNGRRKTDLVDWLERVGTAASCPPDAVPTSRQDRPLVHGQLPIRSPSGAGRHAGLFIIDQAPAPANVNKYPGLVGLIGVRS